MNRYQRGKIYKLICDETDEIYVGSTCEPTLARRLVQHKGDHKLWKNGKRNFVTSFHLFEKGNVEIILLELYSCNSKDELHARERYYIETLDNVINKYIPGRTQKEYKKQYREQNKDNIKEYHKQYHEQNKDKIKENKKQYREQNKDKIKEYKKQYYEQNKDYYKQYREQNQDKINETKRQSFTCQCGANITKQSIYRHYKTKKHINWLNTQES